MNWKLKKLITERYRTQADFSASIGISQSIVSEVIRGRRNLSAKEKKKWSEKLKVNLSEVFQNV